MCAHVCCPPARESGAHRVGHGFPLTRETWSPRQLECPSVLATSVSSSPCPLHPPGLSWGVQVREQWGAAFQYVLRLGPPAQQPCRMAQPRELRLHTSQEPALPVLRGDAPGVSQPARPLSPPPPLASPLPLLPVASPGGPPQCPPPKWLSAVSGKILTHSANTCCGHLHFLKMDSSFSLWKPQKFLFTSEVPKQVFLKCILL